MESKACVASCSAEDGTAKVRGCLLVVFVAYLEDVSSYTIPPPFFPPRPPALSWSDYTQDLRVPSHVPCGGEDKVVLASLPQAIYGG